MLMRAAAELLPPGAELVVFDELRDIPAYDEDLESGAAPDAVAALKAAIAEADAVLIATPEYNGSVPGFLKNALDWVSRPFEDNPLRNKPAAVMGASTGMFGAVWAQAELRKVLAAMGARVADVDAPVPQVHEQFDENGGLHDQDLREAIEAAVGELCGMVAAREHVRAVAEV
jgi:chromate reductase